MPQPDGASYRPGMSLDTGKDSRGPAPGDAHLPTRDRAVSLEAGTAGQVTVEVHRDVAPPVVVVSGCLGRQGGALLAALLAHVQELSGPPVVVDLRQVSHVDQFGLAPVLAAGTVVGDVSPVVDRELRALAEGAASVGRRRRSGAAVRHREPAAVLP